VCSGVVDDICGEQHVNGNGTAAAPSYIAVISLVIHMIYSNSYLNIACVLYI